MDCFKHHADDMVTGIENRPCADSIIQKTQTAQRVGTVINAPRLQCIVHAYGCGVVLQPGSMDYGKTYTHGQCELDPCMDAFLG